MTWEESGKDSHGEPIGYEYECVCAHPGCERMIDRGAYYACGDIHGDSEYTCEKYFCDEHKNNSVIDNGNEIRICDECAEYGIIFKELIFDEETGYFLKNIKNNA